jgi:SAM-dependent methyltransferase
VNEKRTEFDHLSESYDELLADPIRDRFTGAASDFFHSRKRDLIRAYFNNRNVDTHQLNYLDVGCGKGELIKFLQADFAAVSGCDPSAGMMEAGHLAAAGINVHVQEDPARLPFESTRFDFVTAVCVYHHIPPAERAAMVAEISRVTKPGGIFAIIEHNPYNPATRLIVSRTPVDADAILLPPGETRGLLERGGFKIDHTEYFLYLPEKLYRRAAWIETVFKTVPLGGQYAVFGVKP